VTRLWETEQTSPVGHRSDPLTRQIDLQKADAGERKEFLAGTSRLLGISHMFELVASRFDLTDFAKEDDPYKSAMVPHPHNQQPASGAFHFSMVPVKFGRHRFHMISMHPFQLS
jgi:hypothetical protein